MSNFHFKTAVADDTDILVPYVQSFFDEEGIDTPTSNITANLKDMLSSPAVTFMLAIHNGNIAGFVSVTFTYGLEFGLSAEIEDLYVVPEQRGSGLGRLLLDQAIEICASKNAAETLVVITPEGQKKFDLTTFYRKWGFEPLERLLMIKSMQPASQ